MPYVTFFFYLVQRKLLLQTRWQLFLSFSIASQNSSSISFPNACSSVHSTRRYSNLPLKCCLRPSFGLLFLHSFWSRDSFRTSFMLILRTTEKNNDLPEQVIIRLTMIALNSVLFLLLSFKKSFNKMFNEMFYLPI